MSLKQKHDIFQAIADPTRRELLKILTDQELPLNELSKHFSMSRTAVSKHLHILSEAELVKSVKKGRETRYCLEPFPLLELKHWLSSYEKFWDNKLEKLKNFVED
jgi:DNA-binding transcriptional ArsR family regulator